MPDIQVSQQNALFPILTMELFSFFTHWHCNCEVLIHRLPMGRQSFGIKPEESYDGKEINAVAFDEA